MRFLFLALNFMLFPVVLAEEFFNPIYERALQEYEQNMLEFHNALLREVSESEEVVAPQPDENNEDLLAMHEIGYPNKMENSFTEHISYLIKTLPSALAKEIKNIVRRVESLYCPASVKPKKLLLVGSSGVGKTTLAKGIAFLAKRPYILIRAPQLLTKYQFSGAENITNVIKAVLAKNEPFVIIVDEINALTDRFDRDQQADKESATALWLAIDECAKRDNILFIGTTNDGKKMPPPLKTRFKNHELEIPLPDCVARKTIINYYLKEAKHRITPAMLNRLALKAHGLCGRELEDMMTKAFQFAFDRNPKKFKVLYNDIDRALNNIRPHGVVVTALVDAWDNRKEIANNLSPYLPVAGLALNVMQTALNEKNATNQQHAQEKSYKLQQESFEHQKKSHAESHALAKKGYDHSVRAHRESHDLARRSFKMQEEERSGCTKSKWMAAQAGFHILSGWIGTIGVEIAKYIWS